MKPPFYRACRKHGLELEERQRSMWGKESLWCAGLGHGAHKCRSWDVRDSAGEVVAVGFMNEAPRLVSPELGDVRTVVEGPPDRPCKRGHYNWQLSPDGRYRCGTCKMDYLIAKREAYRKQAALQATIKADLALLKPRVRKPRKTRVPITNRGQSAYEVRRQTLNRRLRKEQRCQRHR